MGDQSEKLRSNMSAKLIALKKLGYQITISEKLRYLGFSQCIGTCLIFGFCHMILPPFGILDND